jgi:hypothetical protein
VRQWGESIVTSIAGVELTVSSKELTLLDHRCVAIEGESYAELGVVAAIHESEFRRRDGQARACRKGESDESVGCDHHRDRHLFY